jgi:hypothetical protein
MVLAGDVRSLSRKEKVEASERSEHDNHNIDRKISGRRRRRRSLPSILIPGLDLRLREGKGVGHVAPVGHTQVLLAAELPLEVGQLGMGEGGPPPPGLPAPVAGSARGCAGLAPTAGGRRARGRAAQPRAGAAARVDRVLRVRVHRRVVLRVIYGADRVHIYLSPTLLFSLASAHTL